MDPRSILILPDIAGAITFAVVGALVILFAIIAIGAYRSLRP